MKNYIVKVEIKQNDCEVGAAKVFVRSSKEELASYTALNFFNNEYNCEIIEVKELPE